MYVMIASADKNLLVVFQQLERTLEGLNGERDELPYKKITVPLLVIPGHDDEVRFNRC